MKLDAVRMAPHGIDSRRLAPQVQFESDVRDHCERLLRSPQFDATERSRNFLRFVVDETLCGRGECLNQTAIAMAVFGRDSSFDAVLDPIVRVQAGRLRRSLERYYLLTGDTSSLRIELPKGTYAPVFVNDGPTDAAKPVQDVQAAQATQAAQDWPAAVVVLPFETSSSLDGESAARMQDELTMEISRYGNARVVHKCDFECLDPDQQAAPRFELRGTLRSVGEDFLTRARLVDRKTGVQVWSDEYHTSPGSGRWAGSIDDIGRVIAARVGAEHGVMLRHLISGHSVRDCDAAGITDAILCSHQFFFSGQVTDLVLAVRALQRFTSCEAANPVVWIQLARLCLVNYSFELSDLPTPIEKTIGYACQGVQLDPVGARARYVLAAALLVKGKVQSARDEIEQALRHNCDSLAYRETIGWLMALAGDWDRGMALVRNAAERNPYCLPHVKQGLWADHLRRGEFEKAYVAALEYRDSSGFWPQLMAACCLGHLGRLMEARVHVAELLQAKPAFPKRGGTLIGYYIKSVELRERIVDGLRKAGLVLS